MCWESIVGCRGRSRGRAVHLPGRADHVAAEGVHGPRLRLDHAVGDRARAALRPVSGGSAESTRPELSHFVSARSLCEVRKDLPLSRLLSSAELQRVPAGVPRRQRLLGRPRGVRGAWPLACRPLRAGQPSWQLVVAACRGRVPVSGRSFIVSCSSTVSAED